ncbi:MAG TPA: GguC protein, partial [Bryobacteraceae bacterium]|nr:GguC protein [Bryobacteraceae bacterium]
MRIVQLTGPRLEHRIAMVEGHYLRLLQQYGSTYELAFAAIDAERPLSELIGENLSEETLDYDAVWEGIGDWDLRPSFSHDGDPSRLLVSGTGLTHRVSAQNRSSMHEAATQSSLTDSMRMYYWGLEGGSPTR